MDVETLRLALEDPNAIGLVVAFAAGMLLTHGLLGLVSALGGVTLILVGLYLLNEYFLVVGY